MSADHVAIATTEIHAPADAVWAALVDPDAIARYMFGSRVTSEWRVGSTIVYAGEYEGRSYEDHGRILALVPGQLLRSTHFSPLSGKEDVPENYHTLTWSISERDGVSVLTLEQDNNESEEAARHSEGNWNQVLDALKKLVENDE
jgi:uncharacterized protein YndB with AHSA1/START domain